MGRGGGLTWEGGAAGTTWVASAEGRETMAQPDFFGVVAAVLAVILLVDISVLWVSGKQVPELLGQLVFAVFGFYFGRAPLAPRAKGEAEDPKVK